MKLSTVLSIALCALPIAAEHSTYRLHHRVHHTTLLHLPYSELGTVLISADGSASFEPSPSVSEDLSAFSHSIKELDDPLNNLYYQLALEHDGVDQALWDFSSVKACHLPQVTSQMIILHTHNAKPFAVDFFVSPIPSDGSCPKTSSRSTKMVAYTSPFAAFAETLHGSNTTVLLKSTHTPPLPELRKPPPVTPAGQTIQPVPEKSFIQKYWMYIATAFVVLILAGGEDAGPKRQAQA